VHGRKPNTIMTRLENKLQGKPTISLSNRDNMSDSFNKDD